MWWSCVLLEFLHVVVRVIRSWGRSEAPISDRRLPWMATASLQGRIHGVSAVARRQVRPTQPQARTYPSSQKQLQACCELTGNRSEEHTSELQSRPHLVCR